MNKTKRIGAASAAILLALSMSATAMVTPMASAATAGSTGGKYYTDFATYEEELEYAERLNQEIFADSVVLMKNKNNALPLNIDTESNISLVGMLSYNIITGGTGSGAGNGGDNLITIEDNLKATGFNMNEKAANAYKNSTLSTGSEAPSSILNSASGSFKFYGDVVIWTIGRVGGEGGGVASRRAVGEVDGPVQLGVRSGRPVLFRAAPSPGRLPALQPRDGLVRRRAVGVV